jgi:7-cyano-7-deazaguanine reductase
MPKPETKYLGKQAATGTLEALPMFAVATTTPPLITLHCDEFTSRCPVTGQPDYATFKIVYRPDRFIAETKSVKLWLQSFREEAAFNEEITQRIAEQFFAAVQPLIVFVTGIFNRRGGISVECLAICKKPSDDGEDKEEL